MTETANTATETVEISEKKARMNELNAQIEQGIHDVTTGGKLKNYLDIMAKFGAYGYGNNILIMQQNPTATQLAGFNQWGKQGRHVKKGEKGITIFAPDTFVAEKEKPKINTITGKPVLDNEGRQVTENSKTVITYFKPVSVFDVSQTYGKKLTLPEIGEVKDYGLLYTALKESSSYNLVLSDVENGGKGFCSYKNRQIVINENMSEVEIIKAAVQGITHTTLHDLDAVKLVDKPPKEREAMLIEAEAIAYTICKRYGIEPTELDINKVVKWGENKELPELKNLLDNIRSTSNDLINEIDEKIIAKTRNLTQEVTPEIPPPETEKPSNNLPFGNIKYKDIVDKKYLNVNTEDVPKIIKRLEEQGIKYSGRESDNNRTTFTVEAADIDKLKEIEKSVNIIGNTPFKDLVERNYFEFDENTALKIAAELDNSGVNFSGRIKRNKTTLTVGAADVEQFKAIEKAITAQDLITEFSEKSAQIETIPIGEPPPEVKKNAEPKEVTKPVETIKNDKPPKPKKSITERIREGEAARKTTEKSTPKKAKDEQEL